MGRRGFDAVGLTLAAGEFIILASDTQEFVPTGGTWTKMKEIQIKLGGTVKVYWESGGVAGGYYNSQVYVNGSPVGTVCNQVSVGALSWTETITVRADDKIQLYAQAGTDTDFYVQNFRIKVDQSIFGSTLS